MSPTSPKPPNTGLSGTQFSTHNSAGINDPEGPEKYNNTEMKYGATQPPMPPTPPRASTPPPRDPIPPPMSTIPPPGNRGQQWLGQNFQLTNGQGIVQHILCQIYAKGVYFQK
jgi:hypothetical protein